MIEAIQRDGHTAWRKTYEPQHRGLALRLLDLFARLHGVVALRPPPYDGPRATRATELARLRLLAAHGVRVPDVIDEADPDAILLSDLGDTVAGKLSRADGAAARDALAARARDALVDAHARGVAVGQPLTRNMADDGHAIGFLDFEEDPLRVMSLPHAQARDWLFFVYGLAKYYDVDPHALRAIVADGVRQAQARVRDELVLAGRRLRWVAWIARPAGRGGRQLAHAIAVLALL